MNVNCILFMYIYLDLYGGDRSEISLKVIQGNNDETREILVLDLNLSEQDKCQVDYNESKSSKVIDIQIFTSPVIYDDIKIKFYSSKVIYFYRNKSNK